MGVLKAEPSNKNCVASEEHRRQAETAQLFLD